MTGASVSLKSSNGRYLVAENGGGGQVNANRDGRGAGNFEVVDRAVTALHCAPLTDHFCQRLKVVAAG